MVRCRSPVLPRPTAVTLVILATPPPCLNKRLPFVQMSLPRDSPISGDFSQPSSQQMQSPNKTLTSQRPSSRPRTRSTSPCVNPRTSWVFSLICQIRIYRQDTTINGQEKRNGAVSIVTKRIYVLVGLQFRPSTLWTHLLTATASERAPHEQLKSQIYDLFSNKLVPQLSKIPENAVGSTTNPETPSTQTSSRFYTSGLLRHVPSHFGL
jgi:hypothetical protein